MLSIVLVVYVAFGAVVIRVVGGVFGTMLFVVEQHMRRVAIVIPPGSSFAREIVVVQFACLRLQGVDNHVVFAERLLFIGFRNNGNYVPR